jgi:hypothetical protein
MRILLSIPTATLILTSIIGIAGKTVTEPNVSIMGLTAFKGMLKIVRTTRRNGDDYFVPKLCL